MEHLYSIMPLDLEHTDEICADIKQQYEQGVATCVLFYCKLVPEGQPLINKAEIFGVEWKSGDYIYGGWKPSYYVFERETTI